MRVRVKIVVLLSVILIGAWSCAPKKQPIRSASTSVDTEDYFFPKGPLDPTRSDMDEFARDWYSKHLRAMREPSLSSGKRPADSTYRFLWLRTFDHPIAVRVELTGSASVLYAVELDGAGGYAPGKVAKRVQRALSAAEQESVTAKLKDAGFWEMETKKDDGGLDGAEWILEGVQDGQYHVVDRWSPKSGDYRELCLFFVELAGLSIPPQDIY